MTVVNRRWLVTYAVLAVLASPVRAFTQSVLGEPDSRRLPILADKAAVQLLAAQPVYRVRIIYLIPSNRQPQPHAEQTLQRYALRVQTLYRENMARQGYGEKTITFETEPDGIIPKVNVAHVPQTDSQLQNPDYLRRWTNTSERTRCCRVSDVPAGRSALGDSPKCTSSFRTVPSWRAGHSWAVREPERPVSRSCRAIFWHACLRPSFRTIEIIRDS